jgi:hypothetical protein
MPKRGRNEPKAKRTAPPPHHHQFQKLSFSKSIFNWYPFMFKKGEKVVFQNDISKPS